MASPVPVSTLRDHLLTSLSTLPGSRRFHIHLLVSTARKPSEPLYLYALQKPKCMEQNIFVLLSEEVSNSTGQALKEGVSGTGEPAGSSTHRSFVTAIEATVFAFPTSKSTILYVSKVDGTGQGIYPSPTSTLVKSFLEFYASRRSPLYPKSTTYHLWIHLFARSQRQYLFPNSADHPKKKPLGDVALCKWWKRTLTEVAANVSQQAGSVGIENSPDMKTFSQLYYVLPGQSELEATYLLRDASVFVPTQWIYSHPYNIQEIPFPAAPNGNGATQQLAYLIPHFEDDPKSRFLDELASTSEEHTVAVPVPTPKRKRQKMDNGSKADEETLTLEPSEGPSTISIQENDQKESVDSIDALVPTSHALHLPELALIPPSSSPSHAIVENSPSRPSTPEPPFLTSGAVSPHTPHFPKVISSPLLSPHTPTNPPTSYANQLSPKTPSLGDLSAPKHLSRAVVSPKTPKRPRSDMDVVSPGEFWERMSYRQECAQGAVTGFFVAVFSQTYCGASAGSEDPLHSQEKLSSLLVEGTVPHTVINRVLSSLLKGVEFSTAERTHKSTQVIESAIKGLCYGLRSQGSESVVVKESRGDGFTEDNTDIYFAHVYGSIAVNNPAVARKSAGEGEASASGGAATSVNVLTVKRKKKKE